MFVIVNKKGLFWSSVLYWEYSSGWSSTNPELYANKAEAERVIRHFQTDMGGYCEVEIKELIFKN